MNQDLLYATGMVDAKNYCKVNGLKFEKTTWVLGPQYLDPAFDYSGYRVFYTPTYLAAHPEIEV